MGAVRGLLEWGRDLTSGSSPTPKFKYQFLPADRFPLGSSKEPHPWLAFETDSFDACTTIYPRTTKASFLEGAPSDLGVKGHSHECSINRDGFQYLRDCATVISRKMFVPLSSRKTGCSGESEQTRRAALGSLKKLSLGHGRHLVQSECPGGAIVSLPHKLSPTGKIQGLVVDHWKKAGGSSEAVVLLALVTNYSDDSTGYLRYHGQSGNDLFIYPGLQFLAFRRGLTEITPTHVQGSALQVWPSCFESERLQIAKELNLEYARATKGANLSPSLANDIELAGTASTSARFHQTTRPSLSPEAAVRTIDARDFRTAVIANSIAARSRLEKQKYVRAIKNLAAENIANSDNYISRKMATLLPLTNDVVPALKPQAPKPVKMASLNLEFLRSEPEPLSLKDEKDVRANLEEALNKDKNLRFLNYVTVGEGDRISTSYWQIDKRQVEVRHINYLEALN